MTDLPTPIAYASLALAPAPARAFDAERSRIAEWPWDMWCNICRIRPTSHRTEAQALEAADQHVVLYHAPPAEVHQLMAAGGLAELQRLRAELEAVEQQLDNIDRRPARDEHPTYCNECRGRRDLPRTAEGPCCCDARPR